MGLLRLAAAALRALAPDAMQAENVRLRARVQELEVLVLLETALVFALLLARAFVAWRGF